MGFKKKGIQLAVAFALGIIVLLLPRPEGKTFKITGSGADALLKQIGEHFEQVPSGESQGEIIVRAKNPGSEKSNAAFLEAQARELNSGKIQIDYVI